MATPKVIRNIAQSLITILGTNVPSVGGVGNVHAARSDAVGSLTPPFLVLYLYQVLESPQLRNSGPKVKVVSGTSVDVTSDPLALDLYFLLIPGADPATTSSFLVTYDILAEAAIALHDNAIFSPGQLGIAGLTPEEAAQEYQVTMNPLGTGDLFELWQAVNEPYRLSAAYVVRTVKIESSGTTTEKLVSERNVEVSQK